MLCPLTLDICERGTSTASMVSDRRNPRGRQPGENHRGSARTALQRKPAQRGARTRLPHGPTSLGSPAEEWPHYAPHGGRLRLPLFLVALSRRELRDLRGDPEEAQAAGRAIRVRLWDMSTCRDVCAGEVHDERSDDSYHRSWLRENFPLDGAAHVVTS